MTPLTASRWTLQNTSPGHARCAHRPKAAVCCDDCTKLIQRAMRYGYKAFPRARRTREIAHPLRKLIGK